MERVVGIGPTFSAWKAEVLPIYDTRILFFCYKLKVCMERVVGIEPTFLAWKARVLPIYDTRMYKFSNKTLFLNGRGDRDWTCDLIVPNDARSQLRYTPI